LERPILQCDVHITQSVNKGFSGTNCHCCNSLESNKISANPIGSYEIRQTAETHIHLCTYMQLFEVMCTCRWCSHVYAVYPSNRWLYTIGFILTGVQGLADTICSRSHGGQDLQSDSQSRWTTFAQLARKIVQFALCHLVCFLQRGISKILEQSSKAGHTL